jgi:type II secretory pathway component GspD/PulD (secretin)
MTACVIGIAAAIPWSIGHAQSTGSQTSPPSAPASGNGGTIRALPGSRQITTAAGSKQAEGAPKAKFTALPNTGFVVWNPKLGPSSTTRAASKTGSDAWQSVFTANHAGSAVQKRLTTLFPLKYAEAASVAKTLSSLFEEDDKKNVKIVADVRTNTVIIQATADKLDEIKPVLDHLDNVEVTVGPKAWTFTIIKLKFAQAKEVEATITSLFAPSGIMVNGGNSLHVVIDERTNSLIVQGPEEQISELRILVTQLDVNK